MVKCYKIDVYRYTITPFDLVRDEKVKKWEPLYLMGLIGGGEKITVELAVNTTNNVCVDIYIEKFNPNNGETISLFDDYCEDVEARPEVVIDEVIEQLRAVLYNGNPLLVEEYGFEIIPNIMRNEELKKKVIEYAKNLMENDEELKKWLEQVRTCEE